MYNVNRTRLIFWYDLLAGVGFVDGNPSFRLNRPSKCGQTIVSENLQE
jgi:hypothetical protein